MPRVSAQYKDDQRSEILDAARRCFVRDGFHRTSMQDVFTEAGKSAGAVYRYFPKKEDLILGVATANLDDVTEALRTVLARADGTRGVGDVLAELLAAVTEHHENTQLACIALIVWSEALRTPALAERLDAAITDMIDDLAGLIGERQQAGTWSGSSPEVIAQVLLSVLPGFLLMLALRGPDGVAGFTDALQTVWPS